MALERLEIDANGLTFSARAAGPPDGRPVLLLHGFPETSWSWRFVLDQLAGAGYRAVALDQRGYSTFARPDGVEAYRLAHLVDDVVGVADTMEWPTFDLVGHDWGGLVAWVTAARHAGRVRSLTSVSTPHPAPCGPSPPSATPTRQGARRTSRSSGARASPRPCSSARTGRALGSASSSPSRGWAMRASRSTCARSWSPGP